MESNLIRAWKRTLNTYTDLKRYSRSYSLLDDFFKKQLEEIWINLSEEERDALSANIETARPIRPIPPESRYYKDLFFTSVRVHKNGRRWTKEDDLTKHRCTGSPSCEKERRVYYNKELLFALVLFLVLYQFWYG